MVRSLYLCPTCLDHSVQVESAGFQATTATVTGCEAWGEMVTAVEVPASEPLRWVPWADALDCECGDLPKHCAVARKRLGIR
jgi:hypothetical protein